VWLASGEEACTVQVTPTTCLDELKTQILDRASVPTAEQHIFTGGEELLVNDVAAVAPLLRPGEPLQLLRSASDPRNTDLGHFSSDVRLEPWISGDFVKVRVLASSVYGTVVLYRRSASSVSSMAGDAGADLDNQVAVKEMPSELVVQNKGKDTSEWEIHLDRQNAPDVEDALTEIGIMSYLAKQCDLPLYILKMIGAFSDSKCTYLVTEYAEGGELFGLANAGVRFPEVQVRTYTWQILQAVQYLHNHNIGHRDISLENVLVKNGAIRLMDFGMSALVRRPATGQLLRYFRAVGKGTYRAPECYVPEGSEARVVSQRRGGQGAREVATANLAEDGRPCQVWLPPDWPPGKPCMAQLAGYALPPVDVFAVGVCMFNLTWRVLPWAHAIPSDGYFSFVQARGDSGIEALLDVWKKPPLSKEAMRLLAHMLRSDPAQRPSPEECLSREWFAPVSRAAVPVHRAADGAPR